MDDATVARGPRSDALVEGGALVEGDFLADLCHHVRTPLNGILGALELLLDSDLNEDARELARTAFQSAADLHDLFERDLATVRPTA